MFNNIRSESQTIWLTKLFC